MPVETFTLRFDLVPTEGGCQVTLTADYKLKYSLLGKAMDAAMMRRMMTKNFTGLLGSLDHHLTTGKDIEKGWKPSRAA